ncbi:hypothetical protein OEZ85_000915 [Tetradesmus obliquus]|uniref:Protein DETOXIFICATION n=1 Tax=Tetradesmus obliquus TaxID=3088 RepID=A0ABY8UQ75_TETOB|nr:hypothetical protein OEZ85_000915 [Tetradesmus obliquus]
MGSHEDDDAVHKGRLRSIWTHTVDISRLQGQQQQGQAQQQQQQHGRAYSPPGSPSKAFISSAAAQALLPGMRAPGGWCLLGRLDREVLCNALACAGASMADPLMSMVDTYFSGQLGTTALAALGSNGALFSVMYFLCFTALAVLCTQAMASANSRGDAEGVGRGFLQALAATAVVAVLLVTLLLLLPEQLLGFFQTNAEVMPYAKTYCMIRALSLPAALAMNVCQAAFRSLLDLSTPFAVVMAANAANYALDSLLMLRLGWGMAGCGIASVVSQYIGAGLFAAIIVRRRHQFGIPEALARAADRAEEAQQQQQQQQSSSSCEAAAGKQQLCKLPRLQPPSSTVQRLLLLLASLEWRAFVGRFLGMSLRGLLILSTYSTASMVAARAGTASLAAHQVVQQQQQLQMSFAWSFLHVGQSMTANVFHAAPAAGGGPRAARRLATRIVRWAAVSCAVLAMLTYHNRQLLSGLFTGDAAVRQLVGGAVAPATIMLGLAWNNALEGCLLGADDQPFVVKVYPYAVAAALLQLGRAWLLGLGLPGVWWGLVGYYLVLLAGFGGRFFVFRGRI